VAGLAAVFTPAPLLAEKAAFFEVGYSALDGAAGQLQLRGDGADRRVAFAVPAGAILEVHVHSHRPVRQFRYCLSFFVIYRLLSEKSTLKRRKVR